MGQGAEVGVRLFAMAFGFGFGWHAVVMRQRSGQEYLRMKMISSQLKSKGRSEVKGQDSTSDHRHLFYCCSCGNLWTKALLRRRRWLDAILVDNNGA